MNGATNKYTGLSFKFRSHSRWTNCCLDITPLIACVDTCDDKTLIVFLIGAHQDNFNRASNAVAMHVVRRAVVATEHRPVAVNNLCTGELLRHFDCTEAITDGIPDGALMLLTQLLKE